jgi:hypothetical protein
MNNIHRVSSQAVKNQISYAYFVGQGVQDDGTPMSPVVAKGKTTRFSPILISQQSQSYLQALFGKAPKQIIS